MQAKHSGDQTLEILKGCIEISSIRHISPTRTLSESHTLCLAHLFGDECVSGAGLHAVHAHSPGPSNPVHVHVHVARFVEVDHRANILAQAHTRVKRKHNMFAVGWMWYGYLDVQTARSDVSSDNHLNGPSFKLCEPSVEVAQRSKICPTGKYTFRMTSSLPSWLLSPCTLATFPEPSNCKGEKSTANLKLEHAISKVLTDTQTSQKRIPERDCSYHRW